MYSACIYSIVTPGLCSQSGSMKFSLVAVLVAVLAIGSQAASLVKRESPAMPAEVEKIASYFQDLVQNLKALETPELANKAKAYIEESRAQFQPMVEKLQEQLKPLSSNIEEQMEPLAASVRAQITPYTSLVQSQFEEMLKFMVDQTKAILPPQ
ncbi:type-4 ice-structuring protein LS-12-like [Clarias gariepinus]|uniref:type-4 ice-structuring protein LS-12-like n=1 Tax=Clarias gariepinus TaxID=13013 RepID=UPI00234C5610|nr:type-4 ice-structuring protein LS-12-like [Clarias gariepinus]